MFKEPPDIDDWPDTLIKEYDNVVKEMPYYPLTACNEWRVEMSIFVRRLSCGLDALINAIPRKGLCAIAVLILANQTQAEADFADPFRSIRVERFSIFNLPVEDNIACSAYNVGGVQGKGHIKNTGSRHSQHRNADKQHSVGPQRHILLGALVLLGIGMIVIGGLPANIALGNGGDHSAEDAYRWAASILAVLGIAVTGGSLAALI